jgi:hypothetical protein
MSVNRLRGSIPTELGLLTNLKELVLFANTLTGGIPTEIGMLTKLEYLDLGKCIEHDVCLHRRYSTVSHTFYFFSTYENCLTGTFPTELGLLRHLEELNLRTNRLEGSLDPIICDHPLSEWPWILASDCNRNAVTCECCTTCCNDQQCRDWEGGNFVSGDTPILPKCGGRLDSR